MFLDLAFQMYSKRTMIKIRNSSCVKKINA